MKFITLIAIVCTLATQSGCVSHRAAKYAIHRTAKARKEARKEARESRREAEAQEAYRTESGTIPMTPRDDARSDFR